MQLQGADQGGWIEMTKDVRPPTKIGKYPLPRTGILRAVYHYALIGSGQYDHAVNAVDTVIVAVQQSSGES